jgi:[protein-PII] uridylyltransferase
LAGASGIEICERRTEAVDRAVVGLFERFDQSGMALAALGGYGRREMTPGSDIDLLFLHEQMPEREIRSAVNAVLYPLWDAGMALSHSVRTVGECTSEAEARVESLTTVLDARLLAGSGDLVERARAAVTHVAATDLEGFGQRLKSWRDDRGRRYGHAGRILEPDLKESVGGLRDIAFVGWVGRARGEDSTGNARQRNESADLLLLARTALHLTEGGRSTRLRADYQEPVARLMGLEAERGWQVDDVLMRMLIGEFRLIGFLSDFVFEWVDAPNRPPRVPAGPRVRLQDLSPRTAPDSLRGSGDTFFSLLDLLEDPDQLVPGWSGIRRRPQRDPYHQYPVDIHLVETVKECRRLLLDPNEPFVAEASALVEDPTPLLLGALLHDIGKVGKGSHVPEGITIAAGAVDAMAISPSMREDVLFLVGEHLLLSETATRRDLEEEDLILSVAARIGDARRLALLYLLTIADARATGPSASTPWRMNLIRDLVSKVSHVFERGLMDPDQAGRLKLARTKVRQHLVHARVSEDEIEHFLLTVPHAYLLWVDPAEAAHHVPLTRMARAERPRVHVGPGRSPGAYGVAIGAPDRLGLLANVAGSFALSGLSILSAQAFTTTDGVALDMFEARGAFEEDVDPDRWKKFEETLGQAHWGQVDLDQAVKAHRAHYPKGSTAVAVAVKVEHDASDFFTVVEVEAPDRPGLLFDLARAFAELGLDVHVAKVATYGARVVDVFYVRDQEGQKVTGEEREQLLVHALSAAASS